MQIRLSLECHGITILIEDRRKQIDAVALDAHLDIIANGMEDFGENRVDGVFAGLRRREASCGPTFILSQGGWNHTELAGCTPSPPFEIMVKSF